MAQLTCKFPFFKTGNSLSPCLTKNDKEILHANLGYEFKKVISPDDQSITFRKRQAISVEGQKAL